MQLLSILSIPAYELTLVMNVALSFVAGVIIGYDRERSGKAAGIRTQMLICVGSALIAGISVHLKDRFAPPAGTPMPDPARLMAQIVSGIGFVGAGVILKSNNRVSGVTTAATLWVTGAIGIALGAGFYLAGAVTTACVLLLEPIASLQYRFGLKSHPYILTVDSHHWEQVNMALDSLQIKHKMADAVGEHKEVVIYSSDQKNRQLSHMLRTVSFEIEEIDE